MTALLYIQFRKCDKADATRLQRNDTLQNGDFATKRQQLVSLRVLFLCRLRKDSMVPSLEWLLAQLFSSMKEPEGLISSNRVAHP